MLRKMAIVTSGVVGLLLCAMVVAVIIGGKTNDPAPVDPTINAGRFDPNAARPMDDTRNIGASRDGWIESVDANGRVARQFRYGELTPRAEGEFDVTQPEAVLFLAPHRVVHLSADSGYIVAPDNFPQRGRFTGGVKIHLFEAKPGDAADTAPGSADHVLTAELEDAAFDARSGRIQTAGDVVVRANQAEFYGRGMTMVYNEPNQRIDYLSITEGQSLRYTILDDDSDVGPATGGDTATGAAASTDPIQYYRIDFERDVHVRQGGRSIDAKKLLGYFALQRGSDAEQAAARPPRHALAQADGDAAAPPADQIIIMTWAGKMVMRPEAKRPAMLRTPNDMHLSFTGEPVVITSDRNDRITCAELTYLQSTGHVEALGSPGHALTIDAPQLGDVEAAGLIVRLNESIATLRGPGRIAGAAEATENQGLPPGFAISWKDRLDLHLADGEADEVERAAFYGNVQVVDERFAMTGEQLDVGFADAADGGRQIDSVTATRAAVVAGDGTIYGDRLKLEIADGRNPISLHGKGRVKVKGDGDRIAADELVVAFAPPSDDEGGVRIAQAVATGNVSLQMSDGAMVHAPRLDADERTGRAVLSSVGDERVTIKQDNAALTVDKLVVTDRGARAEAAGAGEFTLIEPADDRRPHGRTVRVTWTDGMTYREGGGTLDLVGNVVASSTDQPTHENRLSGRRMRLELADEAIAGVGDAARQRLNRMKLDGDVVMLSTRWTDRTRDGVETRLRIGGPQLVFDNATERAVVTGAGSMLVEDYRRAGRGNTASGRVALSGRGATVFTWTGSMTMDGAKTDLILDRGVNMTHKPAGDATRLVEMQADKLVANMKDIGGLSALETSRVESMTVDAITATGSVQVRDAEKVITAESMRYEGDSETVTLTAPAGRDVVVANTNDPRPIRASKITWDLRLDRLSVDKPGY